MAYEYVGSGVVGHYYNAGAPGAGTNEVQTLTIGGTPDGGTFKLAFDGHTTAAITWTATDATLLTRINTALDNLPNVDTSGIVATAGTLSNGIGTVVLTFSGGNMAKRAVPTITVANNSLTGTSPTLAVAETTPGVTAAFRDAAPGSTVTDTTNKKLYIHTGTQGAPTWTVVGSQS